MAEEDAQVSDKSGADSVERIRAAVETLSGVRVARMSRAEVDSALEWLSQGQSVITSLMRDLGGC